MSDATAPTPHAADDPSIEPDMMQFDRAEFTTPAPSDGPRCMSCQQAIVSEYYELGGKIFCDRCHESAEKWLRGGSRFVRLLKALVFGSVAAAIGATLYYAILRTTGYNIGLVAVVVGAMVGGAVRKGSGNRGGPFYQVLAVFLTYSAIVAMYVPLLFEEAVKSNQAENQNAAKNVAAVKAVPKIETKTAGGPAEKSNAKDSATPKIGAARDKVATKDAAAPRAETADLAAAKPSVVAEQAPAAKAPPSIAAAALLLLFLVGFLYTIPVQLAMGAPISGLIFGFALWEAWKMNRRVNVTFSGPFRVGTTD